MISDTEKSTWPFRFIAALVLSLMAFSVMAPRLWRRSESAIPSTELTSAAQAPDQNDQPFSSVEPAPQTEAIHIEEPVAPIVSRVYGPILSAEFAPPVARQFVEPPTTVEDLTATEPPVDSLDDLPEIENPSPLPVREAQDTASEPSEQSLPEATPEEILFEITEETPTVDVPPMPADEPPKTHGWPYPQSLVDQLRALPDEEGCGVWALSVIEQIDRLMSFQSLSDEDAADVLSELHSQADEAHRLASNLDSQPLRVELMRGRYAVLRRLKVWRQIHEVEAQRESVSLEAEVDAKTILARLGDVEPQLSQLRLTPQWREYLLIDDLIEVAKDGSEVEQQHRELARRVLLRIESPVLTERQQDFFQQKNFQQLKLELRRWAHERVDLQKLVLALERYEEQNFGSDAALVADSFQTLRWSPDEKNALLGERLDTHYRNANVRVAIAGSLINRMLPNQQRFKEDVEENILGAQVIGRSETSTRLFVRLLPDRRRIRVGLEARGEVASDTEAYKGPAVFYNLGLARYEARKLMTVDNHGVRVWRSEAEADSNTDVTGVETNYDGLPFLGSIARSLAIQQHSEKAYLAEYEVEERIADKASSRLDREVHRRLLEGEKRFHEKVLYPLQKLKLNPVALDMQTTQQRIIIRYRLAGFHQLGAYTPRPQAPSDSLLSIQIHESALNNTAAQLKLDGKRVDLRELYRDVATAIGRPDAIIPEDLPEGITLQFAEQDAVTVRFRDGRMTVTLRLAELSTRRGGRWKDFEVRGNYLPDGSDLDAKLTRDSYVELSGKRLGLGDQIALRGIFTRVFSQKRPFSIIPDRLASNPKMQDLRINQFIIEGGWIGVAIGPDRTKTQPYNLKTLHEARKPE